jgi:hypothetical protein
MIANAILFAIIAIILCAAAVLGWLGIGQIALSGSDALARDGLARGQRAPAWALIDSAGAARSSPPAGPLQLIVFADHSLKSFPSVVSGLRDLCDQEAGNQGTGELDVVIMTRGASESAVAVLGQLGLGGIPVLTGSPALYADYNVRVMPFAIFVDSAGLVRASSLLNHDWQVAKLRQIGGIPIEADDGAEIRPHAFGLAG